MAGHDIIVIGASAGGVEALVEVAKGLPVDLGAAVFVCVHIPPRGPSFLPDILSRAGPLQAAHAINGEQIEPGKIYIAPPDRHLLVRRGHIRVLRGPKENGFRPAADPLFRSAALAYRSRVIGVILSGSLDDGTAGVSVIQKYGGKVVVQDPETALFPGMPLSAIQNVAPDAVLPLFEIAGKLADFAREEAGPEDENAMAEQDREMEIAETDSEMIYTSMRAGTPSIYTCPECHGTLWEVEEGTVVRFRCRTGHAFSIDSLLSEQTQALDAALWAALRALEEKVDLGNRLADRAERGGQKLAAGQFKDMAGEAMRHIDILNQVIRSSKGVV